MMGRLIEQRLAVLEQRIRPMEELELTDDVRRWFLAMCVSPVLSSIQRFADYLAQRRYHAAIPENSQRAGLWVGDWLTTTSHDERCRLIQAEIKRLITLRDSGERGDDDTLTEWVETADREGWPQIGGLSFSMMREGFDELLQLERSRLDSARSTQMPGAVLWRREYPSWHRGMTGDEALEFDMMVAEDAARLRTIWFGESAA